MAGGGWLGGLVELLLLRLEVGGGLGAHLFGCKKWFVRSVILDRWPFGNWYPGEGEWRGSGDWLDTWLLWWCGCGDDLCLLVVVVVVHGWLEC